MSQKRRKSARVGSFLAASKNTAKEVNFERAALAQPGPGYAVLTNKNLLIDTLLGLSASSEYGTGYLCELLDLAALSRVCFRVYQMLRPDANLRVMREAWANYLKSGGKKKWAPYSNTTSFGRYLRVEGRLMSHGAAFVFRRFLETSKEDLIDTWRVPNGLYRHLVPACSDPRKMVCIIAADNALPDALRLMRQFCAFLLRSAAKISLVHRVIDIAHGLGESTSQNCHLLLDTLLDWWDVSSECRRTLRNERLAEGWERVRNLSTITSGAVACPGTSGNSLYLYKATLIEEYAARLFRFGSAETHAIQFEHALNHLSDTKEAYSRGWGGEWTGEEWRSEGTRHMYDIFVAAVSNEDQPGVLEWLLERVGNVAFAIDVFYWIVRYRSQWDQVEWVKIAERHAKVDYSDERTRRTLMECLANYHDDQPENSRTLIGWFILQRLSAAAEK